MKKAIIFSGNKGTGKTWITCGIMNFFEKERTLRKNGFLGTAGFTQADHSGLEIGFFELVVIEECKGLNDITLFGPLMERYPDCNFIFSTQMDVKMEDVDCSKYHLVRCMQYVD